MKYSVQDMWMTLAWIRELAPIIIHIDLPSIETFLLRLGPSWRLADVRVGAEEGHALPEPVRDPQVGRLIGSQGAQRLGALPFWPCLRGKVTVRVSDPSFFELECLVAFFKLKKQ